MTSYLLGLQILDEDVLFGGREVGAIGVTTIIIARKGSVEGEIAVTVLFRNIPNKANVFQS